MDELNYTFNVLIYLLDNKNEIPNSAEEIIKRCNNLISQLEILRDKTKNCETLL